MSRARAIGRGLMGGKASSGIAIGAGAVVGIASAALSENVEMFRKYWYGLPLLIGVSGHVVKQMSKTENGRSAGSAMLGAAGIQGYYGYKLNKASAAAAGETRGVQSDAQGPVEDYVRGLRQLPDTAGVQAPMRQNTVMSMRTAA